MRQRPTTTARKRALTRATAASASHAQWRESDAALRRRLHQATLETDLAAIFTIHGFCARVLREHALESGQGFDAATLLTNDRDLRAELAADLWRFHAQDSAGADDLAALWSGGFEDLSKDLPALLREPVLLPPVADDGLVAGIEAMQRDVLQAQAALQQAWNAHGEDFLDALAAAIDADVMNRNSYRQAWLADLRQWLQAFAHDPWLAGAPHPKLEKLTATALATGTKKGNADRTPASAPMSQAVSHYLDALLALDGLLVRRRGNLLHRLRDEARTRLSLLKRQRRVQTYDDLIDGVADALAHDEAGTLVRQLRSQYAVALVDEFQDTDARQWAIFDAVFGSGSAQPALFVIGDPKQAIYGFRGGDVHTYLAAAKVAASAPALSHNFRSRPAVLRAVAALYANAGDAAFIDPRIEFRAVEAGHARDDDFLRDGQPAPALTVWRAPKPPVDEKGKQKPWSAGESREFATQACVAAIHGVLSAARAGIALVEDEPVQPGDIAVLVRSHREATMIRRRWRWSASPPLPPASRACSPPARRATCTRCCSPCCTAPTTAACAPRCPPCCSAWTHSASTHLEADGRRAPALATGARAGANACCAVARWHSSIDLCKPCRTPARPAGWRAAHEQLPATGELLQEAQRDALGLHGLVDWLRQRDRQRRCATTRRSCCAWNPMRVRADRHPAQEQGPGVSAGVPALRRHRRQAAARAHARRGTARCTMPAMRQPALEAGFSESDWEAAGAVEAGAARRGRAPALRRPDPRRPRAVDRRRPVPWRRHLAAEADAGRGRVPGGGGRRVRPTVPPTGLPLAARRSPCSGAARAHATLRRLDTTGGCTASASWPAPMPVTTPPARPPCRRAAATTNPTPAPATMPSSAGLRSALCRHRYGVALHAVLEHADFAAWRALARPATTRRRDRPR
jgi:hypothetical protein